MKRPLLLAAGVVLTAAGAAAQSGTDGTLTWQSAAARAPLNAPGLPPQSEELAYDGGDYQGHSRNVQNAGILPGWPHWALQVRFTPTASTVGPLLEVRYAAVAQWGTTRDFDLVVRDDAGAVLHETRGLTAVLDSQNWQVVNVSAWDFVPGGRDFFLEIRPAGGCGGANGFTIPYSTLGSGRSAASDDCAHPFASFASEPRDYFLRAVVSTVPPTGLHLQASGVAAGAPASITLDGVTPLGDALFAWSRQGAGPVITAWGDLHVSPPVRGRVVAADAQGRAALALQVPAGASGRRLWMHAVDLLAGSTSNPLALTVP